MNINFYANCKSPFKILVVLALMCTCSLAVAQKRSPKGVNYDGDSWDGGNSGGNFGGGSGWGVGLNVGYDMPAGVLGDAFNAAPTYGLSILNNWNAFTFNVSAGYLAYGSVMGTVYIAPEDPTVGYFKQGPFKVYQLYAGAAYNLNFGDNFRIYGGLNLGVYYTRISYEDVEGVVRTTVTTTVQNTYIAPKLGFTYLLNGSIGLGLEGKSNLFTPTGNSGENGTGGYGSFTANAMLTYNF